jgi:hypothetical protein
MCGGKPVKHRVFEMNDIVDNKIKNCKRYFYEQQKNKIQNG